MKTLWCRNNPYVGLFCLIWICGLLLILGAVKCAADTNAVQRNDWYFFHTQTNGDYITLVQSYVAPGVTVIVTHTNNLATIIIRNALVGSNGFAQLTGWNAPDARLAVELPQYMPYTPPPLSPEQWLVLSNKVWLRWHPTIVATPKSGAGNRVALPFKPPLP